MLREVAGNNVVVAIGKATVDFNGLISLNDTGAFLWKQLEKGADQDDLLSSVLDEYDIDEADAKADIAEFIEKLKGADLLE